MRDGKRERDKRSERRGKYLSALMSSQSSLVTVHGTERQAHTSPTGSYSGPDPVVCQRAGFRFAYQWKWKSRSAQRTPSSWRSVSSLCLAWPAAFVASFTFLSKLPLWPSPLPPPSIPAEAQLCSADCPAPQPAPVVFSQAQDLALQRDPLTL